MNILHSLCVRCGFLVIPAITRLGNVQSFKTYIFRFWAYVCIKLRATVACGGDVSENTFAFQSIKVTESNLTPSFLYIPGLCVTWWILCHQVTGNLQVNGSFRVGLMSVICMAIYKCTNNNNISKAYSRLRDMWVNSYENDYDHYMTIIIFLWPYSRAHRKVVRHMNRGVKFLKKLWGCVGERV